ncbi:MAG: DUF2628 domain-containing protein, partial [Pseudomonadota bacterium]
MMYTLHAPDFIAPEANRIDPDQEDARFDSVVAIPDGLAKWALILPPFWLIWHRLWGALVIYAAIALPLFLMLGTGYSLAALCLGGLPGLYLLLEGHNLRRDALARSGWQSLGVVEAQDEKEAILRFLTRWSEIGEQSKSMSDRSPALAQNPVLSRPGTPDDRLAFGL